ncbi:hypothetical protein [Hyphomicrobium sp. DY-1]|uniref:hypothetical protein n=1 Tax=Hyphomicrobium sp. DY-1 TaxID=3075650 RepID=UPI0039C03B8E
MRITLVAYLAFSDLRRNERRSMPRGRHRNPPRPARFTDKGKAWYPDYAQQTASIVGESRDGFFWRVKLDRLKSVIYLMRAAIEPDDTQTSQVAHDGARQPTEHHHDEHQPQGKKAEPHHKADDVHGGLQ